MMGLDMETDMNGHHSSMEGTIGSKSYPDSNMETLSLREELDRINTEFMRANEERAKAAEYGLVLLEEKQQLQYKMEELTSLYETTKQELDMSTITLRQVSRDYEKRIKDVERQREVLLSEMEEREKELSGRVGRLEEERRGLERQLKRTSSQHDYLTETNTTLSNENDRLKKDITLQSEELRSLKKQLVAMETELEQTRTELDKTRPKLDKLIQYEHDVYNMTEQNTSLKSELLSLQEQYDSVVNERDELLQQTREVYEALNQEREAKSALETKLQVDMFRTPDRIQWPPLLPSHLSNSEVVYSSAPTSPTHSTVNHSTPFTANPAVVPSLLSELQNSLLSPTEEPLTTAQEVAVVQQSMELKLQELETRNEVLESEREEREKQLSATHSELEILKTKYQDIIDSSEVDMASMRDELDAKKEIVGQLKNKITSLSGEKASLEIELDGVKEELLRTKDTFRDEREKLAMEMKQEQIKSSELQGRVYELEEKLTNTVNTVENLETILVHSSNEVSSMKEEVLNLIRAISSLHSKNNKLTLQENEGDTHNGTKLHPLMTNNETADEYLLSVQEGKRKLGINSENQSLSEVIILRELLQKVRIPLEGFTKRMLEHSLETSSQHMGGSESMAPDLKTLTELEGNLNKTRARLANRTEEVNQLRSIMKARQTTVDVTVSSLKSKLESQLRAHDTEINTFKHKLKTLRKERDDQTSLCALTSKRCQEYLGEISKLKRKVDEARGENDRLNSEAKLLDVYLQRAIKQKLDISQQLERYREMEERNITIPLTLSASRV